MFEVKVQAIQDWPKPWKVKDIQFFLGFANFYCHFIFNYSEITIPLTHLTHKDTPWNFSDDCHSAFQHLKDAFTSTPILTHYILDAPLLVETDTFDYAITGILSICCLDEELWPVTFFFQTMTALKLNYDTYDKKLLTIHESFQAWQHYLKGSATPIDIVTDHKGLEYFTGTKILTRRQACWSEFLCQFNLIVQFRPG